MAVKTLSATAIELFLQPELISDAKKELNQRVGNNFNYEPLLGDRLPPLNYRK